MISSPTERERYGDVGDNGDLSGTSLLGGGGSSTSIVVGLFGRETFGGGGRSPEPQRGRPRSSLGRLCFTSMP